jgi:hypothetical protein
MATRAEWSKRVRKWERSGLDIAEFARREGLKPKLLGWWRWNLQSTKPAALGETNAPRTRSELRVALRVRNERLGDALERLSAAGAIRRLGDRLIRSDATVAVSGAGPAAISTLRLLLAPRARARALGGRRGPACGFAPGPGLVPRR